MPLVYVKAMERHQTILRSDELKLVELLGFAKCVARKNCMSNLPILEQQHNLRKSLEKQINDWQAVSYLRREDEMEALADIRNVAGLLFLALEQTDIFHG
jgi:hypothetical protein